MTDPVTEAFALPEAETGAEVEADAVGESVGKDGSAVTDLRADNREEGVISDVNDCNCVPTRDSIPEGETSVDAVPRTVEEMEFVGDRVTLADERVLIVNAAE